VALQAGDTVLIESHAGFVPRQRDSRDFYLISSMPDSTPINHRKAPLAFFILAGMVVAAALSILSMLQAAALAAALMVSFRCATFSQARRNVEWNVLIVIGAALGLGLCLEKTGAAPALANALLRIVGNNPWIVLAAVYFITSLATEVITNNAAAVLIFPIALNAAERLNVNPMPFVICLMIGASASFSTPIGYQTNLMVYGPGGYKFSDYLKIGIPLNLIFGAVAVGLAPLIWPFK
jgi:di/tricarboxylate transporter